jgi:hypothetical protein
MRIIPRVSLRVVVTCIALGSVAASCGNHEPEPSHVALDEPLPECDAYVDAYRACFGGLGAEAHRLTEARSAMLEDRFVVQARSSSTRESARKQCRDGARQLREACR